MMRGFVKSVETVFLLKNVKELMLNPENVLETHIVVEYNPLCFTDVYFLLYKINTCDHFRAGMLTNECKREMWCVLLRHHPHTRSRSKAK